MLHINFLCGCTHRQSVWGPERWQVSVWKPLLERSIGWFPCLLTCCWLAGWLAQRWTLQPGKRHDSAYASVCTASKHVSFFWVAKVTPGLEEITSHLLSTQLRDKSERKTDSREERKQISLSIVWFRHSTVSVFITVVCGTVYFQSSPAMVFIAAFQFHKTCSRKLTEFLLLTAHL